MYCLAAVHGTFNLAIRLFLYLIIKLNPKHHILEILIDV